MRKLSLGLLLLTLLLIGGPLYMWQFGGIDTRGDWRSAGMTGWASATPRACC